MTEVTSGSSYQWTDYEKKMKAPEKKSEEEKNSQEVSKDTNLKTASTVSGISADKVKSAANQPVEVNFDNKKTDATPGQTENKIE